MELRLAREARRFTQASLSEAAGLHYSLLSMFESGERRPADRHINALAAALQVDTTVLMPDHNADLHTNLVGLTRDLPPQARVHIHLTDATSFDTCGYCHTPAVARVGIYTRDDYAQVCPLCAHAAVTDAAATSADDSPITVEYEITPRPVRTPAPPQAA